MTKVTGEGFSKEPYTEDEWRKARERDRLFDQNVLPHLKFISALGVLKSYLLWLMFGIGGTVAYVLREGWFQG